MGLVCAIFSVNCDWAYNGSYAGIDFSVCLLSLKHSMCLIKCLMDFVGSKFVELFDWLQLMSSELTLLFADRHFVCKNSSIYGCLFCLLSSLVQNPQIFKTPNSSKPPKLKYLFTLKFSH
jgi:hypothetical protein